MSLDKDIILYRYTKRCHDECLRDLDDKSNVKVVLEEFQVLHETPAGYWFEICRNKRKWTSKNSKRRFAYPTKLEALENFKRRTQRSIYINEYSIDFSKLALEEAEKIIL